MSITIFLKNEYIINCKHKSEIQTYSAVRNLNYLINSPVSGIDI